MLTLRENFILYLVALVLLITASTYIPRVIDSLSARLVEAATATERTGK